MSITTRVGGFYMVKIGPLAHHQERRKEIKLPSITLNREKLLAQIGVMLKWSFAVLLTVKGQPIKCYYLYKCDITW